MKYANGYEALGSVAEVEGMLLTAITKTVGSLNSEQVQAVVPNVRFALQKAFEIGREDVQEIDGINHESERQGE